MTPWRHNQSQRNNSGAWGAGSWRNDSWSSSNNSSAHGRKWWECCDKNCVEVHKKAGHKPRVMHPNAKECSVCGTHWDSEKQVRDLQLATIKEEVKQAQQLKKTPAADAGKVEVVMPRAQNGGQDVSIDSEEEEDSSARTVLCLPEEYVTLAKLLADPWELAEEWSAAVVLDRYLPKKAASNNDKLRQDLEDQKSLMALQLKKLAQGSADATSKKISAIERQIAKSGTEEEGAALAACELELGRKQYALAEGARLARANLGAQNALERADRLEEICLEQMAAWEEHLATIRAERTVRDAAWLARRLLIENRDLETMELANEKIQQAKALAGDEEGTPPTDDHKLADAAAEFTAYKKQAMEEVTQIKQAAAEEKQLLINRLEALEKAAATAQPQQPTVPVLTADMAAQCHRTIIYNANELPDIKGQPEQSYKKKLVLIATNLRQWGRVGQVPCTYKQILNGANNTAEELEESFAIIQDVVGEVLWKRFYSGSNVTTDLMIPFQMGTILQDTLLKAEVVMKTYGKLVDYSAQASAAFKALHEEDLKEKKDRSGKYSTPY